MEALTSEREATVIAHLLLRPHADHLARVRLAVPMAETELSRHVAITVLEDENRSFVHLDSELSTFGTKRVVDIGLLSRANTPIQLRNLLIINHLFYLDQSAWIETILYRGSIRFVFDPDPVFVDMLLLLFERVVYSIG